jgi:uncharacterized protein YkwD
MKLLSIGAFLLACGPRPDAVEAGPTPPPEPSCGAAAEGTIVALTNRVRTREGLRPLRCEATHIRAARAHSRDQCKRKVLSHEGADGSTPWDRLARTGAKFSIAGENVAMGNVPLEEIHQGWMESPGHRENIERAAFRRIGVGRVDCGGGVSYWTQVFSD